MPDPSKDELNRESKGRIRKNLPKKPQVRPKIIKINPIILGKGFLKTLLTSSLIKKKDKSPNRKIKIRRIKER